MSNDNVELVRSLYRAASVSRFIDLLDEEVEFDFSAYPVPGPAVLRGKEAAIDWCRSYWGTWDEYILEPSAIIDASEDQVVVVQHERARGKRSGVRLERHWAVIFTIRAGRVVRFEAFRTSEEALAAAGQRASSLRSALGAAMEAALTVRAPASASEREGAGSLLLAMPAVALYQSCLGLGSRQPCAPRTQGVNFRRRIAERAIRTRRRSRRMIVQVVKYKSGLSDDEVRRVIAERAPRYEALPRLRQKLYIRQPETGEYGGIYVWDDEQSMREFRESDLAATIPEAYRVEGEPRVEIFELVSVLRADEGVVPAL